MSPTRRAFLKGAAIAAAPLSIPAIGLVTTRSIESTAPVDVSRATHLTACGLTGSLAAFFTDRYTPEEAARQLIDEGRADWAAVREIALWYTSVLGHLIQAGV